MQNIQYTSGHRFINKERDYDISNSRRKNGYLRKTIGKIRNKIKYKLETAHLVNNTVNAYLQKQIMENLTKHFSVKQI